MTDAIAASCRMTYYPAYHNSGTRSIDDIKWIVLHDEEAPTAASAASYFRSPSSGGSAHLCVDDEACYRCLANTDIPWGAASAFSANTHGFHIEQAGYAKWSAVIWKSHLKTLQRAAYKTAYHCKKFGIPVQFVTASDLPNKRGITTHNEISAASRRIDPNNAYKYSHSDPGPFWPRTLFMALVKSYYKKLA